MSLAIQPIRTSRDLESFIRLPWRLYHDDSNWTPPLLTSERKLFDRTLNPFWKHAEAEHFLARRNGRIVGRISAIVNRTHNELHGEKTGFWGFYECERDAEASLALFRAAEEWMRSRGMERSLGPANPSINDTAGLLIDGFKWPAFVLMTYNPRHYVEQVEAAGYGKAMDLWAYILLHKELVREKIDRVANEVAARAEVTIRNVEMKHFERELRLINEIYNDAWEKNWGFVPMTEDEIRFVAEDMKSIVLPELVYFAYYRGEPVAFSLAVPDINHLLRKCKGRLFPFGWFYFLKFNIRKIPTFRVIALGVRKKYQHLGMGTLFYKRYFDEGLRLGYKAAEMSWILEVNEPMNKPLQNMGGKPYKTYRMYDKRLEVGS